MNVLYACCVQQAAAIQDLENKTKVVETALICAPDNKYAKHGVYVTYKRAKYFEIGHDLADWNHRQLPSTFIILSIR